MFSYLTFPSHPICQPIPHIHTLTPTRLVDDSLGLLLVQVLHHVLGIDHTQHSVQNAGLLDVLCTRDGMMERALKGKSSVHHCDGEGEWDGNGAVNKGKHPRCNLATN